MDPDDVPSDEEFSNDCGSQDDEEEDEEDEEEDDDKNS